MNAISNIPIYIKKALNHSKSSSVELTKIHMNTNLLKIGISGAHDSWTNQIIPSGSLSSDSVV